MAKKGSNNYFLDGRRLSCQLKVYGDISIDVTEQVERDNLAHKKIRGFRDGKHQTNATHAKLDTFVLEEVKQSSSFSGKPNKSDDRKS